MGGKCNLERHRHHKCRLSVQVLVTKMFGWTSDCLKPALYLRLHSSTSPNTTRKLYTCSIYVWHYMAVMACKCA